MELYHDRLAEAICPPAENEVLTGSYIHILSSAQWQSIQKELKEYKSLSANCDGIVSVSVMAQECSHIMCEGVRGM